MSRISEHGLKNLLLGWKELSNSSVAYYKITFLRSTSVKIQLINNNVNRRSINKMKSKLDGNTPTASTKKNRVKKYTAQIVRLFLHFIRISKQIGSYEPISRSSTRPRVAVVPDKQTTACIQPGLTSSLPIDL